MSPDEPRPPRVRDEPDRLLTLGEAAELLGVADMELGQALRAGQLETSAGWRLGRLTRLVRAGDLVGLDGEVAERLLPEVVPVVRADMGDVEPCPDGDGDARHELVEDVAQDLDHLRSQVDSAREDNQRLMSELAESGREVQELFDRLKDEEDQHRAELARQRYEADRIERTLARGGARRWLISCAVTLAVALLVWALLPRGPGKPAVRAAVRGLPTAVVQDQVAAAAPAEKPVEEAVEEPVEEPVERPVQPILEQPNAPDLPAPTPQAEPTEEFLDPPLAEGAEPACLYYAATRPGSELRSLLGPCSGRWNPSRQAIAATVHRGQAAYCRHHHFFATTLGGSVERARQVARFAEQEGLLAPLVKLRVDRAGSAFLRRRVEDWIESGFEAGLAGAGAQHELERGEGEDAWSLRSWVRYFDVGGLEHRRAFRMDLVLGDGARGDRLVDFAWLD
jgi:hypothetical protein